MTTRRPSPETRKKALTAALTWAASAALFAFIWWLNHQTLVLPPVSVPATMLAIVGIGFAAGLVSGRVGDIPLTCASAIVAFWMVYRIHFALYPNWPESEDGLWVSTLLVGLYLVPFMVIGHLLALAVRRRRRAGIRLHNRR